MSFRPPPSGPSGHQYPHQQQPDFSRPPPGYSPQSGPPPSFRPSGSNASALPPRPGFVPPGSSPAPGGYGGGAGSAGPGPAQAGGGQTTLFIGGISPGISDEVLEQLLNACGQLRSLKRVSGATGKPQPFGFAEFEDPDAVLRALVVLNGIELPNLENRSDPGKKLIVKADEKTRKFLDEYESMMLRTDADDELEASSVRSITHILSSLSKATPLPSASSTALNKTGLPPTALPPVSAETPSHLRDLQAEDLPEDKRAGVLSQIGSFRSAQNERERERKKAEEEKERRRIEQVVREGRSHPSASPGGGGPSSFVNPYQQGGHSPAVNRWQQRQDPQSYNHPVAFVPAGGRSAREKTDEELEEERRERKRREADDHRVQRERRLDNIERQRTQRLEREAQAERTRQNEERRAFESARDKESRWDSDDEAEHGSRELWISDRSRWRSQRSVLRRREEEADKADARQEALEIEQAERDAADRLAREAREMEELAQQQKAAGILTDEVAPVKLSIGHAPPKPSAVGTERRGVAFDEEEEDEGKKKRVLVKLDPLEGLQGLEREAKRRGLLTKIAKGVPKEGDKDAIFGAAVVWSAINETNIQSRLLPAARAKLEQYLGELEDEDLLNFVLEHVREHKGPEELVEGLEIVLEEDALSFALHFWRLVIFEGLAGEEGVGTDGFAF